MRLRDFNAPYLSRVANVLFGLASLLVYVTMVHLWIVLFFDDANCKRVVF